MNQYLNKSTKTLTDLLAEEWYQKGYEIGVRQCVKCAIEFGLSKEDVMTIFRISEETYQEVCEKGSGTA